jgi:hypothetical protein
VQNLLKFCIFKGSEMLVLPLVVMGIISAIGGVVGLRLPETLFKKLPQTMEEGEEFGKDFGMKECLQCFPTRPDDLIEMKDLPINGTTINDETTPLQLEGSTNSPSATPLSPRRRSMRKILVHQMSSLELPVDKSGLVKLHYWY